MSVSRVSADEIDELIQGQFAPKLAGSGFTQVKPRRWIRSTKAPIREIVQVVALKGASYIPVWGVSVDFIPHRAGRRFAWHRTERSALFDLRVDPLDWPDEEAAERFKFGRFAGRGAVGRGQFGTRSPSRAIKRSAAATVRASATWFDRIDGLGSLRQLFEEAQARPVHRFSFDGYVQHRLAYAFVLAALGETERGDEELAAWLELHGQGLLESAVHDLGERHRTAKSASASLLRPGCGRHQ